MTLLELSTQSGNIIEPDDICHQMTSTLAGNLNGKRVLVLIPDHTRSLPLPFLFRQLVEILSQTTRLDFLVALGTHPPLSDENLNKLVGITAGERQTLTSGQGFGDFETRYSPPVQLFNHSWEDPSALLEIGTITQDQVQQIASNYPSTRSYVQHSSLRGDVPVRVNKAVVEYDHILILAPTFPHEVVGFSGGYKYLFPGISGPEMINATHWLGALSGVVNTIGIQDTPVREMIHAAAEFFPTPIILIALVVEGKGLSGCLIGDPIEAWRKAANLSAQRHIKWMDRPFKTILSCAPPMYDELWTAGKAMYKLEPVVAQGGEVIIYAPHLDTISHSHGKTIQKIGYHTLAYFLADWERYRRYPLGVVAHCTHVRGDGNMKGGLEIANAQVTLASKISPEECTRLNLGYRNPASIDPSEFANREEEGILYVPKAGEILYRLRS